MSKREKITFLLPKYSVVIWSPKRYRSIGSPTPTVGMDTKDKSVLPNFEDPMTNKTGKHSLARFFVLLLAAFFAVGSSYGYGQSDTSSLSGTILDSTGAVVVGAKITVHDDGTGKEYSATTNGSGAYNITNLSPGT